MGTNGVAVSLEGVTHSVLTCAREDFEYFDGGAWTDAATTPPTRVMIATRAMPNTTLRRGLKIPRGEVSLTLTTVSWSSTLDVMPSAPSGERELMSTLTFQGTIAVVRYVANPFCIASLGMRNVSLTVF
jgi:hypothetical protein